MKQRMIWREKTPATYTFEQDGKPVTTTDRSVIDVLLIDLPDLEVETTPAVRERVMLVS